MRVFGYKVRIELILSLIFLIVPIILPLSSGILQPSISEYHYSTQRITYIALLGIIGVLLTLDGSLYKARRYNIFIGLSMIGVICFPVKEYRVLHDTFAIIFFLGNLYIVTYYSKIVTKIIKAIFFIIITVSISFLMFGLITLFIAESIGMFLMAYFMFIRNSILNLNEKNLV